MKIAKVCYHVITSTFPESINMRLTIAILATLVLAPYTFADVFPIKIVTLGDSITRGVRPGVKAEDTFAHQLQLLLAKDGVRADIVNVGIGGERTDQALKRLDAIRKLRPAIVTIMYGTNDSYVDKGAKDSRISPEAYRKNLHKLITELHAVGIKVIVMTEPRWGDKAARNGLGEHPNDRLERYMKICHEVATETKAPLVDHFAHWTKQNAAGVDVGTWTTDQCHPNPRGHAEMARLMLPVVRAMSMR